MNKELKITVKELEQVIVNELRELLPEDHVVEVKDVAKNNGTTLRAIMVELDNKVAGAIFYIEDLYKRYQDGEDIFNIIKYMTTVVKERPPIDFLEDTEGITDFARVKSRIGFRLVNKDLNKKLLEDVPYITICDLAVIFQVSVPGLEEDDLSASFIIKRPLMKMWEISVAELAEVAFKNAPIIEPPIIRKMSDILRGMLGDSAGVDQISDDCDMWVMSNRKGVHGASVLLYPGVLKELAILLESDLIIFPSSIHEVIVVPKSDYCDLECYKEMVTAINATEVDPQDVLSDNVYVYTVATGKLSIA